MPDAVDLAWMQRALELAELGRGFVEPNPLVGAVVVREGHSVGEGWHQRYGEPHAELHALNAAGAAARGATLYVTLEPCCHHGKTPPCTVALLRAGIRRVVAAMRDPFPAVAGQGIAALAAAGIEVEVGLLEPEARRLNRPYLKLLLARRPYVHAKWAMSLDGKICTRTGDSQWISSDRSRQRVHQLRGRMDAILIGIGTALADNPLLTARPPGPRTPARIVLDSRARLPVDSQLIQTIDQAPLFLVTSNNVDRPDLRAVGAEVLMLPQEYGRPRLTALLDELGRRRLTNLLVEGGSEVLGSFLDADAVDEFHVFIAPSRLLGGKEAKSPVGGRGVDRMHDAVSLEGWHVEQIDSDIYLHGWGPMPSPIRSTGAGAENLP